MRPSGVAPAELLEALAQREMGIVGGRIDLEERLERRPGTVVLPGVVVGATEGLEDRRLAGLVAVSALEHGRRLREVPLFQKGRTALQQLVRRLAVIFGVIAWREWLVIHASMVARSAESVVVVRREPSGLARSVPPGAQIDRLESR